VIKKVLTESSVMRTVRLEDCNESRIYLLKHASRFYKLHQIHFKGIKVYIWVNMHDSHESLMSSESFTKVFETTDPVYECDNMNDVLDVLMKY
jgi:alpha-galactosidase